MYAYELWGCLSCSKLTDTAMSLRLGRAEKPMSHRIGVKSWRLHGGKSAFACYICLAISPAPLPSTLSLPLSSCLSAGLGRAVHSGCSTLSGATLSHIASTVPLLLPQEEKRESKSSPFCSPASSWKVTGHPDHDVCWKSHTHRPQALLRPLLLRLSMHSPGPSSLHCDLKTFHALAHAHAD